MTTEGRALLDAGRAADALNAAQRVLEATPDNADALAISAEALLTLERWEDGLAETERLLNVTPDSVWGHRLKCVALENLHRFDAAIDTAREAIRLAPTEANAHFLLAKNLWQTSRDAAAVGVLEHAIELEPDVPLYRFRLAHFLFHTDRAKAEALLERIVADEPTRADALNDLGVLLHLRGDAVRARALYVRALRANPRFEVATRNKHRLARRSTKVAAIVFLGAFLGGAPTAVAIALWRAGHVGWASLALAMALVGVLVTALGTIGVEREQRALAEKGPERSET